MFNVKDQEIRGEGLVVKLTGGVKTQRLEIVRADGHVDTLVFDALGWLLTMSHDGRMVDALPS